MQLWAPDQKDKDGDLLKSSHQALYVYPMTLSFSLIEISNPIFESVTFTLRYWGGGISQRSEIQTLSIGDLAQLYCPTNGNTHTWGVSVTSFNY